MRHEVTTQAGDPFETRVRRAVEALRWPEGPVCTRCGSVDNSAPIISYPGRYQCRVCTTQYRVTTGTPIDGSRIALSRWITALQLLADEPDITLRPLTEQLGVALRSAQLIRKRGGEMLKTPLGRDMRDMRLPRRRAA
jgi:transposase-like protein